MVWCDGLMSVASPRWRWWRSAGPGSIQTASSGSMRCGSSCWAEGCRPRPSWRAAPSCTRRTASRSRAAARASRYHPAPASRSGPGPIRAQYSGSWANEKSVLPWSARRGTPACRGARGAGRGAPWTRPRRPARAS